LGGSFTSFSITGFAIGFFGLAAPRRCAALRTGIGRIVT